MTATTARPGNNGHRPRHGSPLPSATRTSRAGEREPQVQGGAAAEARKADGRMPSGELEEQTADLEGRLRAADEVRTAAEARLLEQEREREREWDSKRKGLQYNRRRAPGGERGPRAAANHLDY